MSIKKAYFLIYTSEVDTALEKIKNLKRDLSSCEEEREKMFKQNLQKDEEINRLNYLNKFVLYYKVT